MLLKERLALVSFEGIPSIPRGENIKKSAAALANPLRSPQQRRRSQMQQPHADVRIARQFLETVIRNLPAKVIAGHVFHLMRFIENHCRILRQNAAEIVLLQRQVSEEKMMIHDDQVRFLGPLLHRGNEALLEVRALLPRAGIASRIQARPQF